MMTQSVPQHQERFGSDYPTLVETSLLKPVATATVAARTEPFKASEFFQNRSGLSISDSFRKRFSVKTRRLVKSAPERPYVASVLKKEAYDLDIRKEFHVEEHLSTLEDIASLIQAQPDGKKGFLVTNGYENIFYVAGRNGEVFAVEVLWDSDFLRWFVCASGLQDVGHWLSKYRLLCPGHAAF